MLCRIKRRFKIQEQGENVPPVFNAVWYIIVGIERGSLWGYLSLETIL